MLELLPNHLSGRWQLPNSDASADTTLFDPVRGTALVRVGSAGLDLPAGFGFAREQAGPALRALTYRERGALLASAVKVLKAQREAYFEIAMANSGTVRSDSALDIDGAIYTLGYYARLGESLGDARFLLDGPHTPLSKDESFQSQHLLVPTTGLALSINAFNFPAWGLWEKAAPALLSGVPVVVKPATSTAWLAQRMLHDVVAAGIFPAGSLSIVCGSSRGLLDALGAFDVLSFTGSAGTAALIRAHGAITARSVRVNVEADSLNSALLLPGARPGDVAFDLLAREVARELSIKSGQKCTAIRRVLVPSEVYAEAAAAIGAQLAKITVGDPRNESVSMGSLVSRGQLAAVQHGLQLLRSETQVFHDGSSQAWIGADPDVAACMGPCLLGADQPDLAQRVHDTEVFGPVATLMPYRSLSHALELIERGQGSLVTSVYGSDLGALAALAPALAATNGRVHVVSPDVATTHTGHGNVMPMSVHGGPGRAGGGQELGGVRALGFYHRRAALQASSAVLAALPNGAVYAS
jgi:3,4-dehydroadipyl-CoA semialdehyde dehydrogenase